MPSESEERLTKQIFSTKVELRSEITKAKEELSEKIDSIGLRVERHDRDIKRLKEITQLT